MGPWHGEISSNVTFFFFFFACVHHVGLAYISSDLRTCTQRMFARNISGYNQTKFVKNELYMERFHGNGLKNLNSAVVLNITPPKEKFGPRGWHKESFLKI